MIKPSAIVAYSTLLLLACPATAATSPWFGVWKLRLHKAGEKPETLIYSDAGGGAMRMESVEERSVLITRFDGKAAPDVGPGATKPRSLAVTAISPTRYRWTFSIAGKPFVQGINSLSPDRRSFKEVSWLVAKPADKVTLVYERREQPANPGDKGISVAQYLIRASNRARHRSIDLPKAPAGEPQHR